MQPFDMNHLAVWRKVWLLHYSSSRAGFFASACTYAELARANIDDRSVASFPSPWASRPQERSGVLRRKQRLRHEPQAVDVSDLDVEVGDLGQGHPRRAVGHLRTTTERVGVGCLKATNTKDN